MKKVRKVIRIPESHIKMMDLLIKKKVIPCYSECIRVAIDRLIARDIKLLNIYNEKINIDLKSKKVKDIKQLKMDEFLDFI